MTLEKLMTLKKMRTAAGMSLVALGQQIGKSKQYMWGLENGRIRLSFSTAVTLAAVFNKTPDIFLSDVTNLNLPKKKGA
jgi:transcriptional regulator with XRE-family HTH domain